MAAVQEQSIGRQSRSLETLARSPRNEEAFGLGSSRSCEIGLHVVDVANMELILFADGPNVKCERKGVIEESFL